MATMKQNIIKLVTGMFNASPGGYLTELNSYMIMDGATLEQLAINLGTTESFKSLYPTYYNGTMFANAFLKNLLFEYNSSSPSTSFGLARDWIAAKYSSGEKVGKIVYDTLIALDSVSTSDATWGKSKQLFDNKVTVSSYYVIDVAGYSTSLTTLQSLLVGVTNDSSTANNAIELITASISVFGSGASSLSYASSVKSATIPLDGIGSFGTSKTINIAAGSSLAALELAPNGQSSYIKLTNSALAPVTSIKIGGSNDLTLDLSDPNIASATTINASSMNANMSLTLNDTIDKNFTIVGGAKDDLIDMGRKFTSTDSVDGKGGFNTLRVELSATNTSDSKMVNIQAIELTAACDLDVSGQTENFVAVGSSLADNIVLGSGNDTIGSGVGNDIVRGGGGSDYVTTGEGADIIVFEAVYATNVIDTITDFSYGYDKLDFTLFLTSEDNEIGAESIDSVAKTLAEGLDLSVDGVDTDAIVDNVGVVYGATNGEISKINISVPTVLGTAIAGKITIADDAKAVVLSKATTDSALCYVYFIEDLNTADDGVQNWSVKLVGVLQNNSTYTPSNMAESQNFF